MYANEFSDSDDDEPLTRIVNRELYANTIITWDQLGNMVYGPQMKNFIARNVELITDTTARNTALKNKIRNFISFTQNGSISLYDIILFYNLVGGFITNIQHFTGTLNRLDKTYLRLLKTFIESVQVRRTR